MKVLKIFATVVVILAVLVAVLIGIALIPGVQTWAVRKAVANQPGIKIEIGRMAAGLSSADLRDVHVVKDGLIIDAKTATARYSAWDYIAKHRVTVYDLTVADLVIDARNPAPSTATDPAASAAQAPSDTDAAARRSSPAKTKRESPSAAFNGILNEAQLPVDVQIARFSVPGRALLPGEQTVVFELTGSNIATGQRGAIDWKADSAGAPASAIKAFHTSGSASVHITTERRIDIMEVDGLAYAEGAGLPSDKIRIQAKADQPTAGGNEGYSVQLSVVRADRPQPLLNIAAQYDAAARRIAGAWNIAVQREHLSGLLNGLGLPDIAANGSGKFTVDPSAAAITASGDLRSDIAHLEKLAPALASISGLRIQTTFDGGLSDNVARLEHFTLDATAADGRQIANVRALQHIAFSLATKRVTFADASADLAKVEIQNLPAAWAQPFAPELSIDRGDLSVSLAVAAEADGSQIRVTPASALTIRNLTIRNGQRLLVDQLNLTVKPRAEYSANRLHAELADLNVTANGGESLSGQVTADVTQLTTSPVVTFSSRLQAKIVAALKTYVPIDTGPLTIALENAGTFSNGTLRLDRSITTINRGSGPLLASVETQQPVTVDLKAMTASAEKPAATAARVRLGGIPLSWAAAFVPNSKFGGDLAGGTLEATLRSATELAVTTTEPLTVRGATIALNGQTQLQNLDGALDFEATKQGESVTYNVRRLEAKQGTTQVVILVAAGDAKLGPKLAFSAKGTLKADAAALAQQPAAASSPSLLRGNVEASFDAVVGDSIQGNASLTAKNLVARANNRPLGDASLTIRATVQADGSSVVNVPFTLTNGTRKSDLLIEGKVARTASGVSFDGRISSDALYVEDLQPLAALAPKTESAAKAPVGTQSGAPRVISAATPTRDTQAFWSAAAGKLELSLKQVALTATTTVSDVHGVASLAPAQLALTSLDGKFGGKPFKVNATIDFSAQQPQPYTLNAAANFESVDVGAIFRALNPSEKPQVETNAKIEAKVEGNGSTLGDTLQRSFGKCDVTGDQGVCRILAGIGGKIASGASGALSLLGQLQGSEGAKERATAFSDLTGKLVEFQFDRFVMHAERGADLNVRVTSIDFLASDIHLSGSGTVTNQSNVPIQNQPMQFSFQLGTKEHMAALMRYGNLLGTQQDAQGYQLMSRAFVVSGTPVKPNPSDLALLLGEAFMQSKAAEQIGNQLQKLLGR